MISSYLFHLRAMFSTVSQILDDNDLDDEALWAVIDSAAAAAAAAASASSALPSATRSLKPQNNTNNRNRFHSPKITFPIISKFASSSPSSRNTTPGKHSMANGEVLQAESSTYQRPTGDGDRQVFSPRSKFSSGSSCCGEARATHADDAVLLLFRLSDPESESCKLFLRLLGDDAQLVRSIPYH